MGNLLGAEGAQPESGWVDGGVDCRSTTANLCVSVQLPVKSTRPAQQRRFPSEGPDDPTAASLHFPVQADAASTRTREHVQVQKGGSSAQRVDHRRRAGGRACGRDHRHGTPGYRRCATRSGTEECARRCSVGESQVCGCSEELPEELQTEVG